MNYILHPGKKYRWFGVLGAAWKKQGRIQPTEVYPVYRTCPVAILQMLQHVPTKRCDAAPIGWEGTLECNVQDRGLLGFLGSRLVLAPVCIRSLRLFPLKHESVTGCIHLNTNR